MKKLHQRLFALAAFALITPVVYHGWGTTHYSPGDTPSHYFPLVVKASSATPPQFQLYRWSELEPHGISLPAGDFDLPPGEHRFNFRTAPGSTAHVRFAVTQQKRGKRVQVAFHTDDYLFESIYRVENGALTPKRMRIGHGVMALASLVIGLITASCSIFVMSRLWREPRTQ